jgi:hypothetical protein
VTATTTTAGWRASAAWRETLLATTTAALLGPRDRSFFKPVCCAASRPWYFPLPPDPVAFHVRNVAFTVVNLALLHRVLLRLVRTRAARTLALLLFAASKVLLTTIGYVMIFDYALLRRPGLPVRVVARRALAAATTGRDPAQVVVDADADFAPLTVTP